LLEGNQDAPLSESETYPASEEESMYTQNLIEENQRFRGTGGRSQENRSEGFAPAFRDTRTGRVYLSRFADGRRAPIHVLDGLPGELVTTRDGAGHVAGTVDSIVAGFVRRGQFMTRGEAARGIDGHDDTAALDAWTIECGNGVLFVA